MPPARSSLALVLPLALAFVPPAAAEASNGYLDHVVVVVMENHSYDEVRHEPYTASLIAGGALCTASYAVGHPSQPNYLALWCGSSLGVVDDACPPAGAPYSAPNLGEACEAAGLSWRAYSENLPVAGSSVCVVNGPTIPALYTRKHDPWTDFSNLDSTRARPYSDLAADLAAGTLPRLAFLIPNNCDNSHNTGDEGCAVADADAWLAAHLPPVLAALGPSGALILTWDEDDGSEGNHILTLFAGPSVRPRALVMRTVTHRTIVRTICDALGLPPFAATNGELPITEAWNLAVAARAATWGALKLHYR